MGSTKTITITEFEASPGAALRRVRAGAVVEVVARGRVVARLVPADEAADPVARALANAPVDEEEETEQERQFVEEGREDLREGRSLTTAELRASFD